MNPEEAPSAHLIQCLTDSEREWYRDYLFILTSTQGDLK